MKYERLTDNNGFRIDTHLCTALARKIMGISKEKTIDFMDTYNRLAEIEDKIEQGKLVELDNGKTN